MASVFQCPHCASVLQAAESQAGQQSQCPICCGLFLVPFFVVPAAQPLATSSRLRPAPPPVSARPEPPFPGTEGLDAGPAPPNSPLAYEVKDPELLHIPCPQCQEVLEVPVEMLHQDVVCPHCQAPFCLHLRDSVEYQRKKHQEQAIQERRSNRTLLSHLANVFKKKK